MALSSNLFFYTSTLGAEVRQASDRLIQMPAAEAVGARHAKTLRNILYANQMMPSFNLCVIVCN